MSHVVSVQIAIRSLEALKRTCEALGLEFMENQKQYSWYGSFVGDSPMCEDFTWHGKTSMHTYDPTKRLLGTCDHAIRVKGNNRAYEIGVYEKSDGTYGTVSDYYQGGHGLMPIIGECAKNDPDGRQCKNMTKLSNEYGLQAAQLAAEQQGWYCERVKDELTIYHPSGGVLVVGAGGIEAKDFVGTACTSPTELLTEAMGVSKEIVNKPELYVQDATLQVGE